MFVRGLLAVAFASAAYAANTNAQINPIVDSLDVSLHHIGPTILTLMANQTSSDATIGQQMTALGSIYDQTATKLAAVPVSSGSNTTTPTNDDISITYSDAMQLTSSSLSGIIRSGKVPSFPTMVKTLDPIMARATKQLNTTLPGSVALVHIMMLDAQQFLVAEGFTQTVAALGF
ncbi:Poxa3b laccase small subunit [Favolaschia claudopus]|uniref:Poxa3b laccase small subunit n=1 Tax=Favolaschia claudopus TaxID=2862362 RepID=A0AAW0BZA0_9AGAR